MNSNEGSPAMTEHVIQYDFYNSVRQHVYVVDCPSAQATIAITATRNYGVCTCGHRI